MNFTYPVEAIEPTSFSFQVQRWNVFTILYEEEGSPDALADVTGCLTRLGTSVLLCPRVSILSRYMGRSERATLKQFV